MKATGVFTKLLMLAFVMVIATTSVLAQQHEPHGLTGDSIPLSALGKAAIGIQTRTVQLDRVPMRITVPGKIEIIPSKEFDQHAPLSGRIAKVCVSLGEQVQEGDVLAIVDSPEMNQLAAELVQNKVAIESEIQRQQALLDDEVKQWQSRKDLADADYKRLQRLLEDKIAAQKDVASALSEKIVADSRFLAAKQNRDITLASLRSKIAVTEQPIRQRLQMLGVDDAGIEKMLKSRETLKSVPVISARAGLVTAMNASAGQSIDPGVMLFTLSDLTKVWATANIYEDQMSRMKLGQKVIVKVAAYGGEALTGVLTYVGDKVDPVTRTLPVRAVLDNPDLRLKPDMFAELSVETADAMPMIVVPHDAVVQKNGHNMVFVEKGDAYRPLYVTLGRNVGDAVEVVDGLATGDRVVVRGAFQLGAELIKLQGGEALFKSPTEGDSLEHGHGHEKEVAGLNINIPTVVVIVLAAFLLGFSIAAVFLWRGTMLSVKVERSGEDPAGQPSTETKSDVSSNV